MLGRDDQRPTAPSTHLHPQHPDPTSTQPAAPNAANPHPADPSARVEALWQSVLGQDHIASDDDFFELGGDSLAAIRMIAQVRAETGLQINPVDFFAAPTLRTLLSASDPALQDAAPAGDDQSDPGQGVDHVLSFDQHRLWLEHQLQPGTAYHVHVRQRLNGHLDRDALVDSLTALINRHDVLRTVFPVHDDQPVATVGPRVDTFPVSILDLTSHTDATVAGDQAMDAAMAEPFDLAQGPLLRALLIRYADDHHVLCVTAHHIICDDWSVGVFAADLAALYNAGGDAQAAGLPPLTWQYQDFAAAQRHRLSAKELSPLVSYWRTHLEGAPPAMALPTRQWKLPDHLPAAGRQTLHIDPAASAVIADRCRDHGATPFMGVLAATALVISAWSGQDSVVVGVPITGRADPQTADLIGFFVNTLPVHLRVDPDTTFDGMLDVARTAATGAYAHAEAPLDVLLQELTPPRIPGRPPLFQMIVNGVDEPRQAHFAGLQTTHLPQPAIHAKFDLNLTYKLIDGGICLDVEYNADRYDEQTVTALIDQIAHTLNPGHAQPPTPTLPDPASPTGWDQTLHSLRTCDGELTAISTPQQDYPYSWLTSASTHLEHHITWPDADNGAIGITREPGAALVALTLACKQQQREFLIVEPGTLASPFNGLATVLNPEEYTLPSPAVPHPDRKASEHTVAVLAGNGELVALGVRRALERTARLIFATDLDVAWLNEAGVTELIVTPAQLRFLAAQAGQNHDSLSEVRQIWVLHDGTLIRHDLAAVRALAPRAETRSVYRVSADGIPAATATLGAEQGYPLRLPLADALGDLRLITHNGAACRIGEVGELWIGADRTGDRAVISSNGVVQAVGDMWIDPLADPLNVVGVLREYPGVNDAVVAEVPGEGIDTQLIAYVAGRQAIDLAALRQHLHASLPESLVPAQVITLDVLPLTPSGEYDAAALPVHDLSPQVSAYVAPRTPIEETLVEILGDLLAVEKVGVTQSFFELGGFSLMAVQLSSRITEQLHVTIALRDIFAAVTVEALAQLILTAQTEHADQAALAALLDELDA